MFHSALAALLGSVTNRTGSHAVSPGAVELESATLRWLAEEIGFPRAARGRFTSGASLATSTALAVARDQAGIDGVAIHDREVAVYLTSQTHHCPPKALKLCGLQRVVRRQVAVYYEWRMQPEALRFAVTQDLAAGRRTLGLARHRGYGPHRCRRPARRHR